MRATNLVLLGLHTASRALAVPQAPDAVPLDPEQALAQLETLGNATFTEIQEELQVLEKRAPPGGQPKCTLSTLQIRREW